jgi:acyl-CoA thioester hydrolase
MDAGLLRPLEFQVDWADLDLFGHMNNVAYFRYIQAARVAFCAHCGMDVLGSGKTPGFMVAETTCAFYEAMEYRQSCAVITTTDYVKTTSFRLVHTFISAGRKMAEGADVLVCYDHRQKEKLPVPQQMRRNLEQHGLNK